MAALVILLLFLALTAVSLLGRVADSRDPDYGMGPVIGRPGRRIRS